MSTLKLLADIPSRLLDPIGAALWALVGALLGHLWSRFRGRVQTLRWTPQVQRLAASGSDQHLGTVEVLYNGSPADNLYLVGVQVVNDGNRDVENFELQIGFRDGTFFLSGSAQLKSSLRVLAWSSDFAQSFDAALTKGEDLTPSEREPLITNRFYHIPVLNRGHSIESAFLVHAPPGVIPQPIVQALVAGVRLKEEPPKPAVWGVRQDLAGIIGLLGGTAALVVLGLYGLVPGWPVVTLAFVIGAFGQLIGVAVVKVWRAVLRLFG